jgi:hypothetical protein
MARIATAAAAMSLNVFMGISPFEKRTGRVSRRDLVGFQRRVPERILRLPSGGLQARVPPLPVTTREEEPW